MFRLSSLRTLFRRHLSCIRRYSTVSPKFKSFSWLENSSRPGHGKWWVDGWLKDMDPFLRLRTSTTFEQAIETCLPFRSAWSATTKLQVLFMLASKAPSESRFAELLQSKPYVELRNSMIASINQIDSNYFVGFLHSSAHRPKRVDTQLLDIISSVLSKERNLVALTDRSLGVISSSMVKLASNSYTSVLNSVMNEVIKRINNKTLDDFQCLADICWSFNTISSIPLASVEPIVNYLSANIDKVPPRSLAIIVWAMQNLYIFYPNIPKPLEDAIAKILRGFFSQKHMEQVSIATLGTLLYSLGKSCFYSSDFYESVSESILSGKVDVHLTSPRFVSLVLFAYQRARYYDPAVMDYLAQKALNIMDDTNYYDVSKIVQAYGYLNHRQEELIDALTDRLLHMYDRGFADMTILVPTMHYVAWSGLIFGMMSPRLFNICMDTELLHRTKKLTELRDYKILQLDVASLYLYPDAGLPCLTPRDRLSAILQLLRFLESRPHLTKFNFHLRSTLETMFDAQVEGCLQSELVTFSGMSLDLEILFGEGNKPISFPSCGQSLQYENVRDHWAAKYDIDSSGIDFEIDKFQPRGDYRSLFNLASDWDIVRNAVSKDIHRRIVFEANGPDHYTINSPRHCLGGMVLKQLLLEAQGWEVISVHHQDWDALDFDLEKQCELLREKIFRK